MVTLSPRIYVRYKSCRTCQAGCAVYDKTRFSSRKPFTRFGSIKIHRSSFAAEVNDKEDVSFYGKRTESGGARSLVMSDKKQLCCR